MKIKYNGSLLTKFMTASDVKNLLGIINVETEASRLDKAPSPAVFNSWDVTAVGKEDGGKSISYKIKTQGTIKYDENATLHFLNAVAPYTSNGRLECTDDTDCVWRFAYRDGAWYKDVGYITYFHDEKPIPKGV